MADVSIIEFIVYAIVGYSGVLMLCISAFRETPSTASQSTIRAIWVLPSLFCVFMLGSAGVDIYFMEKVTTDEYEVLDSSDLVVVLNSTSTDQDKITLYQPVWVTLHILFFFMLLIYFVWNMLQLFTKRN